MRSSSPRPADADVIAGLRSLSVDVAHAAGSFARQQRRRLGAGSRAAHDTKSSDVDPVTEYDRATETMIVDRLRAERPDDSIIGEEGANHRGTSEFEWHIDPIDGTVNFVYDLPGWCTSVGVLHNGEPVAGAIYAPVVDEMYSAAVGQGVTLNNDPITVSGATDLATSLPAVGFSYHLDERRVAQAERLARVMPHIRDIRRQGSAALDLAYVASGRVDAYLEEFVNSWDIAAGILLVTEAGGTVTAFDASPIDVTEPAGVAAATPALHGEFVTMFVASS